MGSTHLGDFPDERTDPIGNSGAIPALPGGSTHTGSPDHRPPGAVHLAACTAKGRVAALLLHLHLQRVAPVEPCMELFSCRGT